MQDAFCGLEEFVDELETEEGKVRKGGVEELYRLEDERPIPRKKDKHPKEKALDALSDRRTDRQTNEQTDRQTDCIPCEFIA